MSQGKYTLVDLSGTYNKSIGGPFAKKEKTLPGWRVLNVMIETDAGSYFIKLDGPQKTIAGIVTCGGLCPGLNDVIRAIVRSLSLQYGVTRIYGFRYGYEGLVRQIGHDPLQLTPESVERNTPKSGS